MKKYVKQKIPVILACVGYMFLVHKAINYVANKAVDLYTRKYT